MEVPMHRLCALALLTAAVFVGGCTSYYRVTDPSTGNEYYTTNVKNRSGGAVTVKDAATGDEVTLQNSHVSKVTKEEYETNRAGKKPM
jgi:hypothetical protein